MASSVSAADAVSKSTLASMGLGSMQVMSDNDGLADPRHGLRWRHHAAVWGEGTADYRARPRPTATKPRRTIARLRERQGNNLSVAGTVQLKYSSSHGLSVRANLGVAGGFSSASAH